MASPTRNLFPLAAALLAVWLPIEVANAQQEVTSVTTLLAEARQALGGDASRAEIKTFKITGRIRSSNRLESGSFEIICALPDRFVQIEQRAIINPGQMVAEPSYSPSVEHRATRLGFNGDKLIFEPHVNYTFARTTNFPPSDAQLQRAMALARAGFANLTLGLFAESFAGVPLHFSAATGSDAETSVLVAGRDATGTLTFNRQTHLPARFGRMRYDDYRGVAGRKVPFRFTDGLDEWIVREFLVNVDIGDKVFRPTER